MDYLSKVSWCIFIKLLFIVVRKEDSACFDNQKIFMIFSRLTSIRSTPQSKLERRPIALEFTSVLFGSGVHCCLRGISLLSMQSYNKIIAKVYPSTATEAGCLDFIIPDRIAYKHFICNFPISFCHIAWPGQLWPFEEEIKKNRNAICGFTSMGLILTLLCFVPGLGGIGIARTNLLVDLAVTWWVPTQPVTQAPTLLAWAIGTFPSPRLQSMLIPAFPFLYLLSSVYIWLQLFACF